MHYLLSAACVVAFLSVAQESGAQDAARFAPLQADQLTAEQKKWADTITATRCAAWVQSRTRTLCTMPRH
jgi:hypothetical protein